MPVILKRWTKKNKDAVTKKDTGHVAFPVTLNLSAGVMGSAAAAKSTRAYALHAVVVHKGATTDAGHYIAFVRDAAGAWLRADDDRVTLVSEDEVRSQSAYMLFYNKIY